MATRTRLIAHFENRTRESQASGWSELWDSGQSDLWDRGKPSPALIDFVESQSVAISRPENGRPLRALVPGCGRGYDVAMLALHGFNAYGLEVSETAVDAANAYATSELGRPSEYNYSSRDGRPLDRLGTVKFVHGNFFSRDWEADCVSEDGIRQFDLIYDYTFLCALLPEMRKDWARRMGELLATSGILVCLEFPLYKDLKSVGPPWGLKGVYWDLLAEGGDGIIDESVETIHASKGPFERTAYLKPPRSYENGKGTDMLSVWALKK